MAERSSELEEINEDSAREVGAELGASTNYATTALNTDGDANTTADDDIREMTVRSESADVPTTGGVTEVEVIADEPEEIRAQIEQTRDNLSETINAIQEKLSFQNIADQVKEEVSDQITSAYDTAKTALYDSTVGKAESFMGKINKSLKSSNMGATLSDTGNVVVQAAKSNPIPFALIGLGVGMLLIHRFRSSGRNYSYAYEGNYDENDYDYTDGRTNRGSRVKKVYNAVTDRASSAIEGVGSLANSTYSGVSSAANSTLSGVSSVAGSAYSGVSSAANTAYEGAGNVAGQAYDQFGNLTTQAKNAARWSQETYSQQLDANPLAVGAVALGLGLAIGMLLPATEIEGQYMGEYREQLMQKAQDAAGGVIEQVKEFAGEAVKTAQEEAKAKGITA